MGFLDKAKENLEKVAKQGQDKLDEVQSKKKADGLLRDLGAWTYAAATGRDNGQGPTEVERITAELHAHEAEHGPLGGDQPAESDAEPSRAASAPAPPVQAQTMPPPMPVPPIDVVPPPPPPPPPPMSEEGLPAGAVPPPPTFAPIPPPADMPQSEGGPKLDEL